MISPSSGDGPVEMIMLRRDLDGRVSICGQFPATTAIAPEILGRGFDEIETQVRFTLANGSATYRVVGYDRSHAGLIAELQTLEPRSAPVSSGDLAALITTALAEPGMHSARLAKRIVETFGGRVIGK